VRPFKTLGRLILPFLKDFFKFYLQAPISKPESSTPPTKANSTERGGRKVSDLQPPGQGKKIAEVVLVRLPQQAPHPMQRPGLMGGVDSHHKA
jgi:hypothetical protein